VSLHPCGEYFATASLDRSWALHDIRSGRTLAHVTSTTEARRPVLDVTFHFLGMANVVQGGYRTIAFHPDGLLLGTVATDKAVRIWDAKTLANIVTLSEHTSPVNAISFSENGYLPHLPGICTGPSPDHRRFYVATAGEDSTVKLWDLRKLKLVNSVNVGSPISQVSFDLSGVYLSVACQDLQYSILPHYEYYIILFRANYVEMEWHSNGADMPP
jgi:pre-mRNA-processing factor 19